MNWINLFQKISREELGLSRLFFQPELFVEQKTNKVIGKFEKFNELQLPIIEIYRKASINAVELVNNINYKNLKLDLFLDNNTYTEHGERFWKIDERTRGIEEDITEKTVFFY